MSLVPCNRCGGIQPNLCLDRNLKAQTLRNAASKEIESMRLSTNLPARSPAPRTVVTGNQSYTQDGAPTTHSSSILALPSACDPVAVTLVSARLPRQLYVFPGVRREWRLRIA